MLFFALVLGFILQTEIYQSELGNFDAAYYRVSHYEVTKKQEAAFLKDVQKTAAGYHVSVFSTYMERNSNYQNTLHIYGDTRTIRASLYDSMRLRQTTYTSLVDGVTKVAFHDFSDLKDVKRGENCYVSYIGSDKAIEQVYEHVADQYKISSPDYRQSTEKDMITIVWGMIVILMILFNVIEAVKKRKEVVIRRSLGEGAGDLVRKAIGVDLLSYTAVFLIARFFTTRFVSGDYEIARIITIYVTGAAVSLLPYLSFFAFDVRKAFSNITDEKGILYLLYGLKAVATALTIFTIATNLSSIQGNLFADGGFLKPYYHESYLTLQTNDYDDTAEYTFWKELYEKEYNAINPAVCINIMHDRADYIFVNKNGTNMLQGFERSLDKISDDTDVVLFVPKGVSLARAKETAQQSLELVAGSDISKLHVQCIAYRTLRSFSYSNVNVTGGIARTTNPVIVYQANARMAIDGGKLERYAAGDIMFRCGENQFQDICKKYDKILGDYTIVRTNVYDAYRYNHNFIVKLLSFLSSLCIMVLALNVAIIIAANTMEYRTNALEISLKKVLGYSLFERHKKLIAVNLTMDVVTTVVLAVLGFFTGGLNIWVCVLTGSAVTVLELLIICGNILMIEKENVQKALKGGSL